MEVYGDSARGEELAFVRLVVDRKPHDSELLTACGISEDFEHRSRLAAEKSAPTLPMLPCADANLP